MRNDFRANSGCRDLHERRRIGVHKFGSGAIAEVVTLSEEWFEFVFAGEFVFPPMGVTPGGGEEARAVFEGLEQFLNFGRGLGLPCWQGVFFPSGKLGKVVGTTCFCSGPDGGALPSAERLALHDGSGDGAVDVGVSDFDVFPPVRDFVRVEGVNAPGEAKVGGVLDLKSFLKTLDPNDGKDGAEEFGAMNP